MNFEVMENVFVFGTISSFFLALLYLHVDSFCPISPSKSVIESVRDKILLCFWVVTALTVLSVIFILLG